MTAPANEHPDILEARHRAAMRHNVGPRITLALLERIDKLQHQLDLAPSQVYVDSLEAEVDGASNLADERLEALRDTKASLEKALSAIDSLVGV